MSGKARQARSDIRPATRSSYRITPVPPFPALLDVNTRQVRAEASSLRARAAGITPSG
jgi:hypothetical protein